MIKSKFCCLFICVLLAVASSGCLLVPVLDSISQVGVTKEDRMKLLPTEVKKFQDALYWGNSTMAMGYVDAKSVEVFRADFRARKRDGRIVESKISDMDFSADAYRADVFIQIKKFNPATLVVAEEEEQQEWVFSVSTGWKILSRKTNGPVKN